MFSPTAARVIGLNEAIIIQQIHFWKLHMNREANFISLNEWKKQLPFLSESTIKRAIKNLREKGLVVVERHNKRAYDKTNWYRIDYDALEKFMEPYQVKVNKGNGQNEPIRQTKMNGGLGQNEPTNTKEHEKNNEKNTLNSACELISEEDRDIIEQIIATRTAKGEVRNEDAFRAHLEREARAGRLHKPGTKKSRQPELYDFSDLI